MSAMTDIREDDVERARAHLRAALVQTAPSDDQIIVSHIRDAYRLLGGRDDV